MVISNISSESQIQSAHQTTGESLTTVEKREEQQDEWRAAVETVLPHLLGRTRFSMEKRAALSYNVETDEDNRPKNYMNAFCDFGRWIGKFGNNCLRSWTMGTSNRKLSAVSLTPSRMKDFFVLLEDVRIKQFLDEDKCKIFADSYLLAMVFTYFLRAGFSSNEYNYRNFFTALVLAHQIEEENYAIEFLMVQLETSVIIAKEEYIPMHRLRYELFVRMDFRALVSRRCCEEIVSIYPEHWAWKRKRQEHHSGVFQNRRYPENHFDEKFNWKSDPNRLNEQCELCMKLEKKKLAITAKLEARTAGKRLSLKKNQHSNQTNGEKKMCIGSASNDYC